MNIAILYICTGKYSAFFQDFYNSCENFFLRNHTKEYFVFTDQTNHTHYKNVNIIYQKDLGWPGNTLFRFKMFNSITDRLINFDYIYFFNANTLFLEEITDSEFIPSINDSYLIGLSWQHIYQNKNKFPYERNSKSKAFIPINEGTYYFQGGILGGRKLEFLKMSNILAQNIDNDYSNNIIAINHDESHLNYYLKNIKIKVLNAHYGRPEEHNFPPNPKIIFRDKNIVLGKMYINRIKKRNIIQRIKNKIIFLCSKL